MSTTINKSLLVTARSAHDIATQQMRAASDASHPLRQNIRAESLLRDARLSFQNLGQTLVPELLRELEEADRLHDIAKVVRSEPVASTPTPTHALTEQDVNDLRDLRVLAREHGWSVSLGRPVGMFMRSLVTGLAERATKTATRHATVMLKEWWNENPDLRYSEVSRGKGQEIMVTLWQINVDGRDIKLGQGQGETLEEAVQRALGTILL